MAWFSLAKIALQAGSKTIGLERRIRIDIVINPDYSACVGSSK
jgi:hypothetical protein